MKVSISIFLGLALIAGAIYYKPSFACSTDNECAVLNRDKVIFVGDNYQYVHNIEKRLWQRQYSRMLNDLGVPK